MKFVGLRESIKKDLLTLTKKEVRNKYDGYVKLYPDLTSSTFERYVRLEHKAMVEPKIERDDNIEIKYSVPKKNGRKRVLVLSDMHCGHRYGLTPPSWHYNLDNKEFAAAAKVQRLTWDWFTNKIKESRSEKEFDVLIGNGDMIDGAGKINSGIELISSDRVHQVKMAEEIINFIGCDNNYFTYGSAYHTGKAEDFEKILAENIGGAIEDQLFLEVNGKLINARHHIGGTSVPYGKATPIQKSMVLDDLNALYTGRKRADIFIRSHVHYFTETRLNGQLAVVTPALEFNSNFGKRKCEGTTNYGFIIIDIYDDGKVVLIPELLPMSLKKPKIYSV